MSEEILELVRRAQAGDSTAFTQLITAQSRLAGSIAFSILNDSDLAADAVQDAYLRAFQRLHQLNEPEAFVAWFLNIVRACSIDVVRRRRRGGFREQALVPESGGVSRGAGPAPGMRAQSAPRDTLIQAEEARVIREALASLPADYREVLLLKHSEGRSYRDIARLLRTSVRSVESKLFRARQQLSQCLRARDIHHPAFTERGGAPAAEEGSVSDGNLPEAASGGSSRFDGEPAALAPDEELESPEKLDEERNNTRNVQPERFSMEPASAQARDARSARRPGRGTA